MQALSLCLKVCPEKIPVVPTTNLGDGADGDVYDIQGDNNKVIKFCVLYDFCKDEDIESTYNNIDIVLSYLENNNISICAHIYSHGLLFRGFRETVSGKQKYILYYYIMEKLHKISEDEKKVFHSIISHEDSGKSKNFSASQVKSMLIGMQRGLDFNVEYVINFYNNLINCPIQHGDLHCRNVMKDKNGKFKLIDFDRSKLLV